MIFWYLMKNIEQERQLQIVSTAIAESRKEAEESQRKLRELEEQVQSDDRVERLEGSLKNTQDRAAELEFQLTKLKQVFARYQIVGTKPNIKVLNRCIHP